MFADHMRTSSMWGNGKTMFGNHVQAENFPEKYLSFCEGVYRLGENPV